jgi:hypothetical protein
VRIPRRTITPNFPDVNDVLFLGIAVNLEKLASSFSADNRGVLAEFGYKLVELAWLHINSHEEEDFAHWIKIPE